MVRNLVFEYRGQLVKKISRFELEASLDDEMRMALVI